MSKIPKNILYTLKKSSQKGASLMEMGALIGLVSLTAVGAVYMTGSETKTALCTANDELRKGMSWDYGDCITQDLSSTPSTQPPVREEDEGSGGNGEGQVDQGGGESWSAEDIALIETGEGGEDDIAKDEGYDSLIFDHKTYRVGESGERFISDNLQASHDSTYRFSVSTPDNSLQSCYFDNATPICQMNFVDVPQGADAVGYRLVLPSDQKEVFYTLADIRFEDTKTNRLLQSWSRVRVSRITDDSVDFSWNPQYENPKVYPVETTGHQYVKFPFDADEDKTYQYRVSNGSIYDKKITACIWKTEASEPECSKYAGNVIKDINPQSVSHLGYIVRDIPDNVFLTYNSKSNMSLTAKNSEGKYVSANSYTFPINTSRIQRIMNLSWDVDASYSRLYPVETTQEQIIKLPFSAQIDGPAQLHATSRKGSVSSSTSDVCIWMDESNLVQCDKFFNINPDLMPAYWGMKISNLPQNVSAYYKGEANFTLRARYDSKISQSTKILVERTPYEVLFSWDQEGTTPVVFPQKTIGAHYVKIPFSGDFNTDLSMTMNGTNLGTTQDGLRYCVWQTESSEPLCQVSNTMPIISPDDKPSHVGAMINNFPKETSDAYSSRLNITTASVIDTTKKGIATVSISREAVPVIINWDQENQNIVYPEKTTGVQYVKVPLTGEFSTKIRTFLSSQTGSFSNQTIEQCYWMEENDTPVCSTEASIPHNGVENPKFIGFKIANIPDEETRDFSGSVRIYVRSQMDSQKDDSIVVTISRTPVPIILNWTQGTQNFVFPAGTVGNQFVKIPLSGEFSTPTRLNLTSFSGGSISSTTASRKTNKCYWMEEDSTPVCNSGLTSDPDLYFDLDNMPKYVGLEILNLPATPTTAFSGYVNLILRSQIDPNYRHTVRVNVSRLQ